MIVCNIAVKWWDEEVKEAIRVKGEAHARYTSSKLRQDGRGMLQVSVYIKQKPVVVCRFFITSD